MAALGDDDAPEGAEERVLVAIKAYPNGSFDMCPGFSVEGSAYRLEMQDGAIFEYTVHNAGECMYSVAEFCLNR